VRQTTNRQINSRLIAAPSAEDIMQIYASEGDLFDDVNLSTAWNRLGKSYIPFAQRRAFFTAHRELLERLRFQTEPIPPRLHSRNLAGVAYGIAKLGYRPAYDTMHRIAEATPPTLHLFKTQEMANLVWAFAKAELESPRLFRAVAQEATARLADFKPQELANTAWAFARAGAVDAEFFDAIAGHAIAQLELFKAQELVNLAWAFTTLRLPAPELFAHIAEQAKRRPYEFNSQELGNLAWSFAKAENFAPDLFAAIAAEVAPRVAEFKSQELSNTAWAFATAGFASPELFEAIAAEAVTRLDEYKTQELANTIWAFATAGVAPPALFDAVARTSLRKLGSYRSQELANTAWAYATVGHHAPSLFAGIIREAIARPREFNPQELTNLAWAVAKRVGQADELFRTICDVVAKDLGEFKPQGIANLAWAFATANAPSAPRLLALIEAALTPADGDQGLLATFRAQEITNTLWACSSAGYPATRLFEGVARLSPARIGDFTSQDVANTAWAFTVARQLRPAIAAAFVQRVLECGIEDFGPEARCQLHQFNMALQLEQPFPPDPPGTALTPDLKHLLRADLVLPPEFSRAFREVMVNQAPAGSSNLHKDVSDAVCRLGVQHVNEICVAVARYHCDIAIGPDPASDSDELLEGGGSAELVVPTAPPATPELAALRSVIIEVNGPYHYTPSEPRVPRPASRLKVSHLRSLGWRVVEVPWWEWEPLEGQRAKDDYVVRKLASLARAPALGKTATRRRGSSAPELADVVTPRAAALPVPRATPTGGAKREAWTREAIDALVQQLVLEVKGLSTIKSLALAEHVSALAQQGKDIGALSASEWRCPGIGEQLSERIHKLTYGSNAGTWLGHGGSADDNLRAKTRLADAR
jgi:hypothetical protein